MGHRRGPGLQPPVSALVSVCEGRSAVTSVTLRTAARSGVVRRAPAPVDAIAKVWRRSSGGTRQLAQWARVFVLGGFLEESTHSGG